ncbi:Creatinase/aminopeptidase [Cylindrobasidium torrendii FP15055 ss-10]|uniref:Creatinase/aminopeptidase n=1 Tax=Cylindrobasidium torrendii FP15055 ss-10 TaxID=1314674 RepID=A0A0D7B1F7_9AGAR|nr:Creatinase/aminopeptidase [Cylindrobasidium torrendii FP15055 ss-10]
MDDDADSVHVRVETSERLEGVRKLMGRERVGIYIIPNNDEHGTEGVAACDQRREYISGFTGPIGTAIITTSAAYLLAPSRYHTQAATQIDENWTFVPSTDWMAFLATIATEEVRVGIDGRLISHTGAAKLTKMIPSKMVYPVTNLVDASWKDRPPAPLDPIFVQAPSYSGEEASSKLDRIRTFLQTRPPDRPSYAKGTPGPQNYVIGILLTRMDEVAWALNLRGSDIPFTPIFRAYFFLSASLAVLFVNPEKLPPDVSEYLAGLSVSVRPYGDVWKFLRKREWEVEGKVIIAPDASYSVALVLSGYRTAVMPSPVRDMMALKNPVELEGLRRAYLRDGVAIVQFFAWLEEKLVHKGYDITEWEAAQRLLDFRKAQAGAGFMGLAGLTKAQAGVNASEEGYVARKATAKRLDKDSPFVLSTGAQYRDGTTSTTRTIHLGDPRPDHIDAYTRVLQGHMAIDAAVFPAGTNAAQLDVLARSALWKGGMDYGHATGTGIGSFLTTSEGPHGFTSTAPLQPGCAITNMQGAYIPSRFGIRLESVLVAKKTHPRRTAGIGGWLAFERLTCVPIQPSLVRWDVLGPAEKAWIQTHNADCLRKLRPFLGSDKRALDWVRRMAEVMP